MPAAAVFVLHKFSSQKLAAGDENFHRPPLIFDASIVLP